MTDHRMVGSVRTCPFLGKFPLAQSIGPVLCFAQWLDVPDLGGGSLSLCLSAEALVHVAEATSIVAEATTLISIYTSECHLLALTMWKANQPARGRSSGRSTRRGGPRRRIHCCKYSLASSSALSCAERVLSLCSSRRRGRSRIAANCQACHPTAQQRGHLEITIEMEAQ